jgi:hypothetical protein
LLVQAAPFEHFRELPCAGLEVSAMIGLCSASKVLIFGTETW